MAAGADDIRVLLVEDDDQDAFLLEKMLREEAGGAAVITRAVEGRSAFDALTTSEPHHCIVLDLRLAGEDGLWLLGQLRADDALSRIPVIVFSGDAGRLQLACADFPNVVSSIRKPETLEQYRAALAIVTATLGAAVSGS